MGSTFRDWLVYGKTAAKSRPVPHPIPWGCRHPHPAQRWPTTKIAMAIFGQRRRCAVGEIVWPASVQAGEYFIRCPLVALRRAPHTPAVAKSCRPRAVTRFADGGRVSRLTAQATWSVRRLTYRFYAAAARWLRLLDLALPLPTPTSRGRVDSYAHIALTCTRVVVSLLSRCSLVVLLRFTFT